MLQNVEILVNGILTIMKETNPYLTFLIFVRESLFYNEFLSRITFSKDKGSQFTGIYFSLFLFFFNLHKKYKIFFSLNQLSTDYAIKTIHLSTVKLVIVFLLLLKNEFRFRKISAF